MEIPNAKSKRDDFLTVTALVQHSGMSRRTLMMHLHDPTNPIPHRKIGGRIYVAVSEFRAWMDQFKVEPQTIDVAGLVQEIAGR